MYAPLPKVQRDESRTQGLDRLELIRFLQIRPTALEGHPVDVAALSAARVGGSAVFTGTVAMFSAAALTEVARTYPTRPVMRLLVERK